METGRRCCKSQTRTLPSASLHISQPESFAVTDWQMQTGAVSLKASMGASLDDSICSLAENCWHMQRELGRLTPNKADPSWDDAARLEHPCGDLSRRIAGQAKGEAASALPSASVQAMTLSSLQRPHLGMAKGRVHEQGYLTMRN